MLSVALALFAIGCGQGGPPNTPVGEAPQPPTRPSDGLLGSSTLQNVVDLQVERDGVALIDMLSDVDPKVRARAAFALGSVQDPGAATALRRALQDPDDAVRRDAAFALGQLSEEPQGAVLLASIRAETVPEVRNRLLEALGKVGDESVLEGLLSLELQAGEETARTLAVSRIGIQGIVLPSSVEYLLAALKNPNADVREMAGYYFGRSRAPGPWASRADEVRAVLDSLPPGEPLAMHLLLGLAGLGDTEDTSRFLWWLANSPDWRVRANAARATDGRSSDPRVRAALLVALDDPVTHVSYNAGNTLAGAAQLPPAEREELREWVRDNPQDWRRAGPILALLGRLGDGEFLMEWLDQWGPEDVAATTRGLGALAFVPGEVAMARLVEEVSSSNARIRGTALGGVARRWRVEREDPVKHAEYYWTFVEGLRSGDPSSIFVAAPALADSAFVSYGSVEVLSEVYHGLTLPDDLEGMQAILGALAETGTDEAEAFLAGVVADASGALRDTAARALGDLSGEEQVDQDGVSEAERRVDWNALSELGSSPRMVLETAKGTVVLVLDSESAPLTVQTILGFAAEGKYDGVPFHRVVPNFVAQSGDFSRRDGFGGPGFSIRSEFTQIPYLRGGLGMASAGKDTEGSQFFITHSMQPHLDGGYTVFGWVVEGMDVVDLIYEDDVILTARVEAGIQ